MASFKYHYGPHYTAYGGLGVGDRAIVTQGSFDRHHGSDITHGSREMWSSEWRGSRWWKVEWGGGQWKVIEWTG